MSLKDAIDAAWARARERCVECRLMLGTGPQDKRKHYPHTCYGDMEVVKDVALAVVDRLVDIAEEDILGPQDAADGVVAELERLLEVKHGK